MFFPLIFIALQVAASKFDLNYIQLDGSIGCLVNGAGLAMVSTRTNTNAANATAATHCLSPNNPTEIPFHSLPLLAGHPRHHQPARRQARQFSGRGGWCKREVRTDVRLILLDSDALFVFRRQVCEAFKILQGYRLALP
jgi:hypothetical protein